MSNAVAYTQSRISPVPALRSLRSRFKGAVIEPGRDGWDAATQAFNTTIVQQPALVAVPADAEDVVAVVEYAARQGMQVAAQRTGHNADPLGAMNDVILVKTDALQGVEIDVERRIARVALGLEVGRRRPEGIRARPRRTARVDPRRQRRRLLARRRCRLVRPQARAQHEQRHRDRARHRRRQAPPRRRRQRPRPVLGAPRRRRELRHRHRAGASALRDVRGLRGRALLPLGALVRGAALVARVDGQRPRRGHVGRSHPAVPADPGHPRVPARRQVRRRRGRRHRRRVRSATSRSARCGRSAR